MLELLIGAILLPVIICIAVCIVYGISTLYGWYSISLIDKITELLSRWIKGDK